jgi:replicative DNA helicase
MENNSETWNFGEPYTVDKMAEELNAVGEGLKTGYPSLDDRVILPRGGYSVIAGRTSHGKTTLMYNLLANHLELYPDKKFLFLTYEEPRWKLVPKIINCLAGKVISQVPEHNQIAIESYLKSGQSNSSHLEEAKEKYNTAIKDKRLVLLNVQTSAERLEELIGEAKAHLGIDEVFIDYVQKIKSKRHHQDRLAEVKAASDAIHALTVKHSLVSVVGAQLNRQVNLENDISLDKIRECGDIEQDAGLVMAVWNSQKESSQPTVPFNVHVLKRRDGGGHGITPLRFNRPVLRIEDKTTTSKSIHGWK